MSELRDIFEGVTERYMVPVRIGSRCEANVFYRVEDLSSKDVETCARYIADRIVNVCSPQLPQVIINLPGSFTGLAQTLATELAPPGETLEVIQLDDLTNSPRSLKGSQVLLVNEVITTARSCLEAHTRVTMLGATIPCWAALIDRTFGPGPVPVVASFTGEPVTLIE